MLKRLHLVVQLVDGHVNNRCNVLVECGGARSGQPKFSWLWVQNPFIAELHIPMRLKNSLATPDGGTGWFQMVEVVGGGGLCSTSVVNLPLSVRCVQTEPSLLTSFSKFPKSIKQQWKTNKKSRSNSELLIYTLQKKYVWFAMFSWKAEFLNPEGLVGWFSKKKSPFWYSVGFTLQSSQTFFPATVSKTPTQSLWKLRNWRFIHLNKNLFFFLLFLFCNHRHFLCTQIIFTWKRKIYKYHIEGVLTLVFVLNISFSSRSDSLWSSKGISPFPVCFIRSAAELSALYETLLEDFILCFIPLIHFVTSIF